MATSRQSNEYYSHDESQRKPTASFPCDTYPSQSLVSITLHWFRLTKMTPPFPIELSQLVAKFCIHKRLPKSAYMPRVIASEGDNSIIILGADNVQVFVLYGPLSNDVSVYGPHPQRTYTTNADLLGL